MLSRALRRFRLTGGQHIIAIESGLPQAGGGRHVPAPGAADLTEGSVPQLDMSGYGLSGGGASEPTSPHHDPADDIDAPAAYRRSLVETLTERALQRARGR